MTDRKRPLRREDLPVMNLGKFVLEKIKAHMNLEAVVDASSGKTYTYNCLIRRSEGLAAGLQQFGVRSGDIICIFSPNHIDYMTVCYATALAGGVLQCINSLLTKDDLRKMIMDGNTKFIITIPDLVPTVKAATHDLAGKKIITFGHCAGCTSLDSLIASSDTPYTTPEVDWTRATSTLWYSSGTTGFPKAVKHTHCSLITNVVLNMRGSTSVYGTGQSLVMFLPMFHAYGMLMCIVGHCLGCRLVVMSRFEADKYLGLIEKYKPVNLQVVPPIMVLLAKYPKVPDYDLSSVKRIICAGAPLSAEVEDAVIERLRSIQQVQQGYGMTEVGFTHYHTVEETRRHSVGKVMELTEMKIVDVKTGRTCGVNEAGEIWVRGPQASHGYLNLPDQTKAMFMDDGWVRTGDIGKQDADGFLYIVDRLKDLIKYKANQVAPASLEDILLRHDAVADVGVIGVSDVEAGELPKAYVVKKQGRPVTERELQNFVAGQVAPFMKLRGGVEFVEQIPRTMSGKILRRVLRDKANNTISKL